MNNCGRPWNISVQVYDESMDVPVVDNCFQYQFTNIGDVNASVNEMIIFASSTPTTDLGDSRTMAAKDGGVYQGNIRLKFIQPTAGTNPQVEIVQAYYTDGPDRGFIPQRSSI